MGSVGVSEKGVGSRKANLCPEQSITEQGEVSTELSTLLNSISFETNGLRPRQSKHVTNK